DLGPITLAWHGLTIAIGILIGGVAVARYARERGLSVDPVYTIVALATLGGLVGGRILYVIENGGSLLGTRGFTFAGGVVLAGLLIAAYVWRARLAARYLDASAAGLPLGVAIGRIGDVINGEHYGPQSDFFLAVRNSHPEALTPDPELAYHSGGLYEVILGAVIFAIVWPLRHRVRQVGALTWIVLALFGLGRFFEFFARSDSPELALGLNNAQWSSLALLAVALAGLWLTIRRSARSEGRGDTSAGRSDPHGEGGGTSAASSRGRR
ncbi:MAG TPA: prolipoprotein diacylglyceryl transferase family protein, partial [Thermoleophilaceae bacterium]|nr:prolipoprotein diacylglyceryl transferase family protein [Thermoleophilaceae bacterium]